MSAGSVWSHISLEPVLLMSMGVEAHLFHEWYPSPIFQIGEGSFINPDW